METYKFWDIKESITTGDKRLIGSDIWEALQNVGANNVNDYPPFSSKWKLTTDNPYMSVQESEDKYTLEIDTNQDDITFILPNPSSKSCRNIHIVLKDATNTLTVQTDAPSHLINFSLTYLDFNTSADNIFFEVINGSWQISSEVADMPPLVFSARNSSNQSFTDTRIDVTLDHVVKSYGGIAHLDSGEIVFDKAGIFILLVSVGIDVLSGSSRSIANSFVQLDTGSGFTDIPDILLLTYNRMGGSGINGDSAHIPIEVSAGDKIKIQSVRENGSDTLQTVFPSCAITIISSKGLRGEKGEKGDTGADGDVVWRGVWTAGTYNTHDGVQYQGSSFICNANGTTNNPGTPASPNAGWDLWVQKGADGSGAVINISEDGTNIPNTPHGTINFQGNFNVSNGGSGVANVQYTERKNTYMMAVWAEENAGLSSGSYEWAYGNGANTPIDGGVTIHVPSGYSCEVVAMSIRLGAGDATVELIHNGVLQGSNCQVVATGVQSKTDTIASPIAISDNDYINFRTVTASSTGSPNVVTAWLKYTEN